MDPGEAADALADLDAPDEEAEARPQPDSVGDEEPEPAVRVAERLLKAIKVDGNFRSIEIVGDDNVREAIAEGPHRVRWEDDVLIIDGSSVHFGNDTDDFDDDERGDWFRVTGGRRAPRVRMARAWDRDHRPRPLRVRVNPDVPLEARVEAGPLTIRRVRGPVKARVAAGPLVIEGFESPLDLRVAAGKVVASGRVDHGVSTIDCDAGKVSLRLERGSDVRVTASATLGKVDVGGRGSSKAQRSERIEWTCGLREGADFSDLGERITGMLNNAFSDEHEVTVGKGTGVMDIRVSMGSADISFEDEPNE